MAVNVEDKIRKLSTAQRRKVEVRAAELIAEEMTLRELRKARQLTQVRLARRLGITQDGVSRLEKRSDRLLSTAAAHAEGDGKGDGRQLGVGRSDGQDPPTGGLTALGLYNGV